MRDQTVGSNSREGGAWPGQQGRLGIAIDWVTSRSTLKRVGSMYSQAHISLFNIYWRVWLLVIREAEKAPLGSLEALSQTGFLLNTWHRYSGEENQSEDILLHVNY